MSENIQAYQVGYPYGWLNDCRQLYILTANATDQGQSQIVNDNSPNILNPPYARVCLKFSLDGNICYTPWFPMNISPMLLPTPNQVRRDLEVVVQERSGIVVTAEEFDSRDFDRAPFP